MRKILKTIAPELLIDFIRTRQRTRGVNKRSVKDVFTNIKDTHYWKSTESLSGDGSELSVTIDIRKGLEELIQKRQIKSVLDIPCGDFNWMKAVNFDRVSYIGGEIVASLVETNTKKYASENITFKELDLITDELPRVDLIFCRDCLVHLSYKQIYKALLNIKRSKSQFLLTTSFVNTQKNKDIITGEWRKLNLELMPFKFGHPIEVIDEGYTQKGERYADKSMCLWKIKDIKIPFSFRLYANFF